MEQEQEDDRTVELSSVEAIFPELVRHGSYTVSLEIPVPLTNPVRVVFPAIQQTAPPPTSLHDTLSFQQKVDPNSEGKKETHHLWNLPPVTATITLSQGYPSENPPEVVLTAQETWIPQTKLQELRDAARQIWADLGHDMVVYSYIEHIQDAAENCFNLAPDGTLDIPADLKVALLDYDSKVKKEKFDNETFDCMMCLEPKKGTACHRLLDCGHVFCVSCLQDFYNSCITEGDVDNVKCINPDCGKEVRGNRDHAKRKKKPKCLQPSELLQIPISDEKVQRYVKIRRKRKFESNPNTVYCPRTWCQGPARVGDQASSDEDESGSDGEDEEVAPALATVAPHIPEANEGTEEGDSEPGEPPRPPPGERLAVCTDCGFAFCIVCKKTWHGEFGWCSVRSQGELSREERASEEYLKKHSTPCPTCNVRSQKIMGCNHMKCRQCNSHFCYLCSSWLSADNPYTHFNTTGTPCYQKLWEMEEGDGAGAPARPEPPPIEVIFEDDPPPGPRPGPEPAHGQQARGGRAPRRAEPARRNDRARPVPPPAPVPPPPQQAEGDRAPRRAEPARRNAGARPVHARPPAPAPPPAQQAEGVRVRRRVQQGLARPEPVAPAMPGHGLQRFLELAALDEEDGWDSDEMDDLEEDFVRFVLRE